MTVGDDRSGTFTVGGVSIGRRGFLQTLAAIGAAGSAAACSRGAGPSAPGTAKVSATPSASTVKIPGPPWQDGVRGGTGIQLWGDSTVTFDPPLAYGQADYYGLSNFFRGLAFYDQDNIPQLDLAESLDLSPDGKVYTFKLKPGITFHNGRAVTAADFKWTFERSSSKKIGSWVQGFLASVKGHKEFVAGTAKEISGIVAKDDRTLVLTLDKPDVTILSVVGIPPFYVMAKEEVARLGDKVATTPVGAGPYKLVNWDDNTRTLTAERFPGYVYAGELPYLDKIEHSWGVAEDVRYLKVSKNEADLTIGVPPSAVPRIKRDPAQASRFKEWASFSLSYWAFDVTSEPFKDVRVRQAFNYAFNRERTAALGFKGTGRYYPPGLLGAEDSVPAYGYDPDKARALLAEAGAGGLSLTLPVLDSGAANNARLAQLLQQDLQAVGVTVNLEQVQQTPYDIGAGLPKEYRWWNQGWGMGLPDPSELVNSLVGTGAPSNYGGYTNPRIDALGKEAIAEADRTKRAALYAQIERLLLADAPFLFFGVTVPTTFSSTALQNVTWTPVLVTFWDRFWKTT